MGQLLFTVIALGIAMLGFVVLAWLQRREREPHTQHQHAGEHPTRRN